MKEAKRVIIKEKAGELGHADCHHLSKSLILNENKRRYLEVFFAAILNTL